MSDDNVIELDGWTKVDVSADRILRDLAEEGPEDVFIISWPKDGSPPTFHSSTGDTEAIVYRLQEFLHGIFNGRFTE